MKGVNFEEYIKIFRHESCNVANLEMHVNWIQNKTMEADFTTHLQIKPSSKIKLLVLKTLLLKVCLEKLQNISQIAEITSPPAACPR